MVSGGSANREIGLAAEAARFCDSVGNSQGSPGRYASYLGTDQLPIASVSVDVLVERSDRCPAADHRERIEKSLNSVFLACRVFDFCSDRVADLFDQSACKT